MQVTDVRYPGEMINGVAVVAAPAEIDITAAEQLRAVHLEETRGGHLTVVVDLTRTLFCDSSGIHTLVRAHKRAVAGGGEVRLVIPADGAVPRIINLTCLDRFMPCFRSLAEATADATTIGTQCSREEAARPASGDHVATPC
jgi:anti-sigma B factor antagonist